MDGMTDYKEIVRRLMQVADVGIVNAKADTQLIRDAAMLIDFQQLKIEAMEEKIYELEERIAIMEEGDALSGPSGQLPQRGSQVSIEPGANVDLWPILDGIEKKSSGLIEEE